MATPTEFFNATLPEEIPIPDWTHLHIPQLPTLKLRWDEIHIDDALVIANPVNSVIKVW